MFLAMVCFLSVTNVMAEEFTLSSLQVKDGERMPKERVFNGSGCDGANISPALTWTGVPEGTKSFAVTVYDPDAPTGSGWWHWVIFNIPAIADGLVENAGNINANLYPAGSIQSKTDYGIFGYGGPCPPAGDKPHRYQFTVYALSVDKLPLDENATAAMVGYYLNQNSIKKASIQAYYSR
ncbi:YbhB/YbcL family Raf kinase inhibitor-like protein [bacterium]|nr:MAG: YbhB/YbcL family Raf kinase inhibitor-like protein [bacterium]